jgi:hypothetical protein
MSSSGAILTLSGGLLGVIPLTPWAAFRVLSDNQIDSIAKEINKKKSKKKKEPVIRCTSCKNIITSTELAISVAGSHRHSFQNPAGIDYEIGCFSSAKGCFNMGDSTLEYTWFPGYTWCYSVCGQCFIHMGWYYRSEDSHFYGLILGRLTVDKK